MRLGKPVLSLLLLAFALGAPLLAEEIVYFTNGTTMPVRGHEVKDGMIHLDLGSDNHIAFPESMVEKIEEAGREVYLKPSYNGNVTAGRLSSGPNDGNFPVSARDQVSASQKRRRGGEATPEYDPNARHGTAMPTREGEHGLETGFPLSGHSNRAARSIGVTGPVLSNPGDPRMVGAQRRGSKWVINGTTHPANRGGVAPTRIGLRNAPPPVPTETDAGAADDGGAGPASNGEGDSDG